MTNNRAKLIAKLILRTLPAEFKELVEELNRHGVELINHGTKDQEQEYIRCKAYAPANNRILKSKLKINLSE